MGHTRAMRSLTCSTWSTVVRCGDGWLSQASFAMSKIPRGLRPYSNSKGENPVDAWGTSRTANSTCGNSWSQFFPSTFMAFFAASVSMFY